MNSLNKGLLLLVSLVLAGCGGHERNGSYKLMVSSEETENASTLSGMPSEFAIDDDASISNGKRVEFDEIFEREQDGRSYLVMRQGEHELLFVITEEGHLVRETPWGNMVFAREKAN